MTSEDALLHLGDLTQWSSVSVLRAMLFSIALIGSLIWQSRRPRLAALIFFLGSVLGLSFWLAQIATPFGLSTDTVLTAQWAQAGVNARTSDPSGFVSGSPAEFSFVATLASVGLPLSTVQALPQLSCVAYLVLAATSPLILLKNRSTAGFASVIAMAGGFWPGLDAYGGLLRSPADVLGGICLVLVVLAGRVIPLFIRRKRPSKSRVAMILLVGCGLFLAIGTGSPVTLAPYVVVAASIALAPRARAWIRVLGAGSTAVRWEATSLAVVFCGGGLFWWNPPAAVPGFDEARGPGAAILKPMEWIAANVPARDVMLASPEYGALIAALSGHRVLLPPSGDTGTLPQPFKRALLYQSAKRGMPIARLADELSVTHLFLGPGETLSGAARGGSTEPVQRLELAYQDSKDFRVFRFLKK